MGRLPADQEYVTALDSREESVVANQMRDQSPGERDREKAVCMFYVGRRGREWRTYELSGPGRFRTLAAT